jgi:hypothetical protein
MAHRLSPGCFVTSKESPKSSKLAGKGDGQVSFRQFLRFHVATERRMIRLRSRQSTQPGGIPAMRIIHIFATLAVLVSPTYAADPRAQVFLQSIYRVYETSDKAVDIGSETKAARYFVPSLAKLIGRDIAKSKKSNEVGKPDFDPFIGGQDWSPTKIELSVADGATADRAVGTARFVPAGGKEQTTVTLDLNKTGAGWRIADIRWAGQSDSLVAALTKKN